MLIINYWYGRLGNNILQIIRCIHFAKLKGHSIIKFNNHSLLTQNYIELKTNKMDNKTQVNDIFFSLKKYNINDPEPYLMKEYFQKYIKQIFKICVNVNYDVNDNDVYIHFRGGDIFANPHNAYVQPPLSYYKDIINHYDSAKLVCEDKSNPCINELLKLNNIEYISDTLEKDLTTLLHASNLIIGFGTFGFLIYLMNSNLKNIYLPDFFYNELPRGHWGDNINVHIIKLPNYIQVGEWENTPQQRKLMIEYSS